MKTKLLLLATISSLLVLTSCDKDDDNGPENNNPHGLWIGTYNVDQLPAAGNMYYSFIIKPNGTVLTEGVGANGSTYYSQGTWILDGDTLRSTYTTINFPNVTVTQSAKFYFNSSDRTLSSGTWKDGANGSNYTGRFPSMLRVN